MAKRKRTVNQNVLRILLAVYDVLWVGGMALASYWMTSWSGYLHFTFPKLVAIWAASNVVLALVIFFFMGLYSMIFASVGFPEALQIFFSVCILGVCNIVFVAFGGRANGIGYSIVLFYCLLVFLGLMASRFGKRGYTSVKVQLLNKFTRKRKVMIVGCNNDAFTLIRNMVFNEKSLYKAVCLIEDDARYLGKRIYDVRVVGSTYEIREMAKRYKAQEIFIAIPAQQKKKQREILERCRESGLPMKLLPELSQMTNGEISVSKLRNVQIEDLLGREQVGVNLNEVMGYIEGKRVLVTGGGGSIGSELCRQIALHNPKQLIILDIYENSVYDIEQELKRSHPDLNLLTLIASIRDVTKVRDVFETYRPQIVFNAAAHKHVPLMETSPNEAVKNNVFGTLNLARAASEFETETFVQISTDKAVNPTNVMGASKRICEMIIQTIGKNNDKTKFVAVRFGNVLGSNGSVIPLFKKQIEAGGPVTVTHKDIIRYFMTIPEAVSLVLQAGAYAKDGQIFVLDMGEPVKIYDLACNLIRLSGFEPHVDIEIQFTGLRPGEKLYEERLMAEEGLQKTPSGQISIAQPIPLDETSFWQTLDMLYEAAHNESEEMKDLVKRLVPTYTIDRHGDTAFKYMKAQAEKTADGVEKKAE